jgi:DNA-binding SARP family transcriptional activator/TolB-like protein
MSNAAPQTRRPTLRLMGSFRLAGSQGEEVGIASRRARALLAYLAMAPDYTATRERLSGLLWSDRGEPQARASLRQCLLELRDILEAANLDFVERGREDVRLRAGSFQTDVESLARTMDDGDSDALASALVALGSDRLLEDLEIPGLYRDWLEQARVELDRLIAQRVTHRLDRLEAEQDWRRARALAEAYLRRDALDEAVVAVAIRADIALGATTTAHRRFQSLETAMAREFGVAPGPAARAALVPLAEGPATWTPARRAPAIAEPALADSAPQIPVVIVAMFDAVDPAPSATRLATDLRHEVLSGLSRFDDFRVLSDPRPLEAVAEGGSSEIADVYVLGANLRESNDGPRLTVQFLTRGERRIIWSESFTPSATDAPDGLEDTIARVVGAVLPIILADKGRQLLVPGERPSGARAMLALGLDARPRTFAEARAVADGLEAMILADPTSAAPLLALSYLYNTDFGDTRGCSSGPAEHARALELAKAALAIDPMSVHARTALGWCYVRQRRWDVAKVHLEKALALNPFHVRRLMEIGFAHILLDETERARQMYDRCLFLNPAPADEYFTDLGLLSMVRGDHDLAETYFEVGANPSIWCPIFAAINARMAGRHSAEKAGRVVSRVRKIWPDSQPLTRDALVGWISHHHPFRSPEVEGRFLTAAADTFSDP